MYNILTPWPTTPLGPPTLAERLGPILLGLRVAACARAEKTWVMAPLVALFVIYLARVMRRFEWLAIRFESGRLRARPNRPRPVPPTEADSAMEREKPARKPRLPQRFGWLIDLLSYQAVGYGSQLRHLLATDPDMRALMAASPQAGRILRPLCRMLGMEQGPDLPPSLFPPKPSPATSTSSPSPSPRPPKATPHAARAAADDDTDAARPSAISPKPA